MASPNNQSMTSLGWVPQPNVDTRGTWGILQSSSLTIFFCTATALHLNIPHRNTSQWRRVWRKFAWMLVAIVAPELLSWTAFMEFREAQKVRDALNAALQKYYNLSPKPDGDRPPTFSLTYAFYVIMGGFAIDVHEFHEEEERLILRSNAVVGLVENGKLPHMTIESINDKSKLNLLGKGLAGLQLAWFFTQCLARTASGLPISITELHACVHILCATAMYLLWLKKPLDVEEAELIDLPHDEAKRLARAMVSEESDLFTLRDAQDPRVAVRVSGEERLHHCDSDVDVIQASDNVIYLESCTSLTAQSVREIRLQCQDMDHSVVGVSYIRLSVPDAVALGADAPIGSTFKAHLPQSDRATRRYEMAREAVAESQSLANHAALRKPYPFGLPYSHHDLQASPNTLFEDWYRHDWPRLWHESCLVVSVLLVTVSATFGGLHALAWNYSFASRPERWMWRASCVYTAGFAVPPVLIALLTTGCCNMYKLAYGRSSSHLIRDSCQWMIGTAFSGGPDWKRLRRGSRSAASVLRDRSDPEWCSCILCLNKARLVQLRALLSLSCKMLVAAVVVSSAMAYVLARIYLVIESFISLRHVPVAVFVGVSWVDYLPHL